MEGAGPSETKCTSEENLPREVDEGERPEKQGSGKGSAGDRPVILIKHEKPAEDTAAGEEEQCSGSLDLPRQQSKKDYEKCSRDLLWPHLIRLSEEAKHILADLSIPFFVGQAILGGC